MEQHARPRERHVIRLLKCARRDPPRCKSKRPRRQPSSTLCTERKCLSYAHAAQHACRSQSRFSTVLCRTLRFPVFDCRHCSCATERAAASTSAAEARIVRELAPEEPPIVETRKRFEPDASGPATVGLAGAGTSLPELPAQVAIPVRHPYSGCSGYTAFHAQFQARPNCDVPHPRYSILLDDGLEVPPEYGNSRPCGGG